MRAFSMNILLCLLVIVVTNGCDVKSSAVWNVIQNIQSGSENGLYFDVDQWRRDTHDNDDGGWDADAKAEWVCWPLCT